MDQDDEMVDAMIANAGFVTIEPRLEWEVAVNRVERVVENAAKQLDMSAAPTEAEQLREAWMRILQGLLK